jgi:CheY-like chemotaxis protein
VTSAVVKDDSMVIAGFELAEPRVDDAPFIEPDDFDQASSDEPLVLVVDDDDDVRRLLVKVIGERGIRVIEAADGEAALGAVRSHAPAALVLDAMLPKVHGFEIARRLKNSEAYKHIPIVMVSAVYRGWRFAEDAKTNYGVDAYLEKPFKVADVVNAVADALEQPAKRVEPEGMSARAEKHLERGLVHYREGRMEKAVGELRLGVQIDPLAFQLHFQLGLVYAKGDHFYDAIDALERALTIRSDYFPALKNLAALYQNAGFRNKAIEMWERCLTVAPEEDTRAAIREHLLAVF